MIVVPGFVYAPYVGTSYPHPVFAHPIHAADGSLGSLYRSAAASIGKGIRPPRVAKNTRRGGGMVKKGKAQQDWCKDRAA